MSARGPGTAQCLRGAEPTGLRGRSTNRMPATPGTALRNHHSVQLLSDPAVTLVVQDCVGGRGGRVRDPGRPQGRTGLGPRAREPCPKLGLRESRVGARPGSGGTRPERGGKGRRLKVKVKKRPRQPLATFSGTSGGLTGVPTGGQTAAGPALGIFRAGVRHPGPPKIPQPTAATRAPGLAPRASTPSPVTPPSGTPVVSRCPRLLATPARRRAGP